MQRIKKLTLKPVISPITSQEKVTYSSSNKKIATVSSSGVITGKKKGTEKLSMIQF
ncbi:Ig-like domain-containing protein [Blautia wexlerae]|nr:Ig-like domain-containing protein [Blautia wexlerae]MCQ5299969.1 Ig-like domain-containing protein [Blautia wexlerae]